MESSNVSFDPFQVAAQFVNQTGKHIFLTGKAGTGKTTFLKYIKETSRKKTAVVAPTGVAAINAGGVTMHSFFQLPLGPFVPGNAEIAGNKNNADFSDQHSLLRNIRLNNNKRELLRELELLIIDEVSMVRADMLDAVDLVLRHFRKQPLLPFGGVQILYIGDLFQLPPVVRNEEWKILREFYPSPFFFDANSIQEAPPVFIELKKIWRQNEERFIRLLNRIRNNIADSDDLEQLHLQYRPGYRPPREEGYIMLTTHNAKADAINQFELERLPGKTYTFEASIKGEFYEKAYPAEKILQLKVGAQIMFTRNDKGDYRRYFNGKIGTISRIVGGEIYVRSPDDTEEIMVELETWKNIRYQYDSRKHELEEIELGSFKQYPIRLAWAITIHKSQGLTFEKAIIDAGESFAAGQVYVALSRLTSLEGLILYSRINPTSILTDERVIAFHENELAASMLQDQLTQGQNIFIKQSLLKSFEFVKILELVTDHLIDYELSLIPEKNKAVKWTKEFLDKIKAQEEVAAKFRIQLEDLYTVDDIGIQGQLLKRVKAAYDYFIPALEEWEISLVNHLNEYLIKPKTKKYVASLREIETSIRWKRVWIDQALQLADALANGADTSELFEFLNQEKKLPAKKTEEQKQTVHRKPKKGDSQRVTLELFKKGKKIDEIAILRSLAKGTIHDHLASFVLTGEVSINELVPENKIKTILQTLESIETIGATPVKERLGDNYSYGEIRAVINYRKLLQSIT